VLLPHQPLLQAASPRPLAPLALLWRLSSLLCWEGARRGMAQLLPRCDVVLIVGVMGSNLWGCVWL